MTNINNLTVREKTWDTGEKLCYFSKGSKRRWQEEPEGRVQETMMPDFQNR